jgi:hypothetical protein
MQKKSLSRRRHHERGQTMVFVAISIVSLLAMAALAIDIVTLYVARSEIQRAADAAALAAAKAIADSGVTSLQAGDPQLGPAQALAQNMATAAVTAMVNPSSTINLVAGAPPTFTPPVPIDFSRQGNPHVTIALQRTNLPTFFSKIWGRASSSVTATATAEVYNPANLPTTTPITPIAPKSVKPWLVANADPLQGKPFIDTTTWLVETGVVGEEFYLKSDCQTVDFTQCATLVDNPPQVKNSVNHFAVEYVPALITPNAGSNVCPACAGATDYEQSIECADVTTSYQVLSCGGGATTAQWDNSVNEGGLGGLSDLGAECLIHATGTGKGKGQDEIDPTLWPTNPMQITAGSGLQDGKLVTTSNSIVTIPIIDTCTNPNCFPKTGGAVTIDGYMQAFIEEVHGGGNPNRQGDILIAVLNIAGCSASNNGANPVVGGSGTSPVPVRLITPP